MKNLLKKFKQGAKMGNDAFISNCFDPVKAQKSIRVRAKITDCKNRAVELVQR